MKYFKIIFFVFYFTFSSNAIIPNSELSLDNKSQHLVNIINAFTTNETKNVLLIIVRTNHHQNTVAMNDILNEVIKNSRKDVVFTFGENSYKNHTHFQMVIFFCDKINDEVITFIYITTRLLIIIILITFR